jgi:hypothetical protein
MLDSGADVSVAADCVDAHAGKNTQRCRFPGEKKYTLADDSTVLTRTFRIRCLTVGDKDLENVTGRIAPVEGGSKFSQPTHVVVNRQ